MAVLDVLRQRLPVPVAVTLTRAQLKPLVHERAARKLVHEAAVDANDGDDAGRAARQHRVAQDEWAVGLSPAGLLGAVEGIQRAVAVRSFHANRVDHDVRPASPGQLPELLDVGILREVMMSVARALLRAICRR